MSTYWLSINGREGIYLEAETFVEAAHMATLMNPTVTTLTIEDHTNEEVCP